MLLSTIILHYCRSLDECDVHSFVCHEAVLAVKFQSRCQNKITLTFLIISPNCQIPRVCVSIRALIERPSYLYIKLRNWTNTRVML